MSNLDKLIEQSKKAYVEIATAYDAADINQKIVLSESVQKAQSTLVALQTANLAQSVTVTDADLAEMSMLRAKINNAAELQSAITGIIGLVSKFLL